MSKIPEWKRPYNDGKITWIITASMVEGTLAEILPKVITDQGHRIIVHYSGSEEFSERDVNSITDDFMDEGSGPIMVYGLPLLVREVISQPWYPGTYPSAWSENTFGELSPAAWMSTVPVELLLNPDHVFIPVQTLNNNAETYSALFNHTKLFIKDNDSFKSFPAAVLNDGTVSDYLTFYKNERYIKYNSFVMVSSEKVIDSEHRFIIVDNKIVSHSTYMLANESNIYREVPQQAIDFVNQNLDKIKITGGVYVLDIAMSQGLPKIIDINAFSCAELYACDLEAVVRAISAKASADFMDEGWDFG